MRSRVLAPEEAQAWARVMASVRPLRAVPPAAREKPVPDRPAPEPARPRPGTPNAATPVAKRLVVAPPTARVPTARRMEDGTLDGSWDRRVSRGLVQPDTSIDLHGHTLASAHALLDAGLDRALARGDRVLLLVTGKPPLPESERPHARGAIRAAVADWLAASRHADRIAAVRGAHPRHGGTGALYLVLRRR